MPAGKLYKVKPKPKRTMKNLGKVVTKINRSLIVRPYRHQAFPSMKRVTMRYGDVQILTTTLGVYNEQLYNMNSIYDPDRTGVGHQAWSYDQWATLYNKYRVINFRYKVQILGGAGNFSLFTVLPTNGTTAPANGSQVIESDLGKYHIVSGQDGNPVTLKGRLNLARFTGKSLEAYKADDIYGANFGANPNELMILHVGISRPDATTTNCIYAIQMEYDVILYDPIEVAQS